MRGKKILQSMKVKAKTGERKKEKREKAKRKGGRERREIQRIRS